MVIKLELERELERRFRELAMKRFGYAKGSIKKAAESAIKQWAKEAEIPEKRRHRDSVGLMVGLLKNVKHKTSVEEQHGIKKLWIKDE